VAACGRCGRTCAAAAGCAGGACTASACTGFLDLPGAPLHARSFTVLVARDLDGDLLPDLVGAWNDTVTVERSLGGGRFAVAQTIVIPGAYVGALVLARLDGDAHLDLAVADRWGWVHVAKGNGDGTFGPVTSVPVGVGADGIAAADLDGDGDLDLAVSAEGMFTQGSAAVLWNDGAGVFSTQLSLTSTGRPSDVAAGDVNGDGRADLVTRDAPVIGDEGGAVRVRLGSGDGTFGAPATLAGAATALAVVDLDGDGVADVLVGDRNSLSVKVFFGAGDGTFAEPAASAIVAIGNVVTGIAAGDLDGDGVGDLVVTAGQTFDRPASFAARVPGLGGGALGLPVRFLEGVGPVGPVLVDLDGDHRPELLVTPEGSAQLTLLRNVGDGSFGPPDEEPIFGETRTLAAADVDRDGRADVLVSGPGVQGVRLLRTGCRP